MNLVFFLLFTGISCGMVYIISNEELLYKIAHSSIFLYSYVGIQLVKYYKKLPFKEVIIAMKNVFFNEIEIIKDNVVVIYCKTENLLMYNPLYMDFFIYSDIESSPVNKVVCTDVYKFTKNYEICDFKFFFVQVILSSTEKFVIQLKNSYMNFFIVNNVIDKYLICYLLYKQYKIQNYEDNIEYTLEIMDHNMIIIMLTEKDELHLDKTTYHIKNVHTSSEPEILDRKYIYPTEDGSKVTENMYFHSTCNE